MIYSYLYLKREYSRQEYQGEIRPLWWLYGKGWRDFDGDTRIEIIIPFNWLISFLRDLWYSLLRGKIVKNKVDQYKKMIYNKLNEDKFNIASTNYKMGHKVGYQIGFDKGYITRQKDDEDFSDRYMDLLRYGFNTIEIGDLFEQGRN